MLFKQNVSKRTSRARANSMRSAWCCMNRVLIMCTNGMGHSLVSFLVSVPLCLKRILDRVVIVELSCSVARRCCEGKPANLFSNTFSIRKDTRNERVPMAQRDHRKREPNAGIVVLLSRLVLWLAVIHFLASWTIFQAETFRGGKYCTNQ